MKDDQEILAGWLAAIIESADDAIVSKSTEGIITSWNSAAERILGYTADEIVGESVLMLIPPELQAEETMILGKIKAGERIEHYETVRLAKDGTRIDVSLTVSPIKAVNGDIIGASKILRDITRQKRVEEELRKAVEERDALLEREKRARSQAETAGRAKDEFLGLLSHELRTPLNSILGWTRLLNSNSLDDKARYQALETIDRNAKLQAKLIDDMLDLSRIISGKLKLDAQPVDPAPIISAAIDIVRPAADAKMIRMYSTLDFGTGTVLGDPVRLQQIVWNLLSNAIKFTPKGGSIQVSLQRINSHVAISVSDSGTGIEEEFLPYIFDRFRQADSTTSKKQGGLGLGLSIVRHLVELHGGMVEAANRSDGPGAMFTVNLPIMPIKRKGVAEANAEANTGSENDHAYLGFESPPSLEGIKVLAVDDEADARLLLETVFKSCGATVATCGSVEEAIRLLEEFEPDVLVSDIGMPGEDGYSLIRRIRQNEQSSRRRIPAVALTAFARTADRFQALSAGYNMHVPKPVEPAELALVVYTLVG